MTKGCIESGDAMTLDKIEKRLNALASLVAIIGAIVGVAFWMAQPSTAPVAIAPSTPNEPSQPVRKPSMEPVVTPKKDVASTPAPNDQPSQRPEWIKTANVVVLILGLLAFLVMTYLIDAYTRRGWGSSIPESILMTLALISGFGSLLLLIYAVVVLVVYGSDIPLLIATALSATTFVRFVNQVRRGDSPRHLVNSSVNNSDNVIYLDE